MNGHLLNPKIVEEVSRKLGILQSKDSCLVSAFLHKMHFSSIERDAVLHSYKIEYPNSNSTRFNSHTSKRHKKKGVKNLRRASNWGNENFNPLNFTEDYVKILAGLVDPIFYKDDPAEYRTFGRASTGDHLTGVRAGTRFTPPGPEKIPREMESFVQTLGSIFSDGSLYSLLEGALYSHLHLVRIHPFEDANGRTARLLQNIVLNYVGLPPPIIYVGERFDYYHHLENACLGWRSRMADPEKKKDGKGEREFYNYLLGKVSASLDRIL